MGGGKVLTVDGQLHGVVQDGIEDLLHQAVPLWVLAPKVPRQVATPLESRRGGIQGVTIALAWHVAHKAQGAGGGGGALTERSQAMVRKSSEPLSGGTM